MDEMTLKVMSSSCKMTEITDEGISCKLSLPKDSVFLPTFMHQINHRHCAISTSRSDAACCYLHVCKIDFGVVCRSKDSEEICDWFWTLDHGGLKCTTAYILLKVWVLFSIPFLFINCMCSCAVVENLGKSRQPLPALDAVYFIRPSPDRCAHSFGAFGIHFSLVELYCSWDQANKSFINISWELHKSLVFPRSLKSAIVSLQCASSY